MISTDKLNQYRSLKNEIEEINRKLKSFQTQATVKASSLEFPYTPRSVTIHGISPGHGKEVARLKRHKANCIVLCREIESFIYGINDSLIRRIFEYRYIEGRHRMSWQRIATEIGERDESYPRRKHNGFLKLAENAEKSMLQ